ncbi:MAG: metallophosphoesterase [Candidatus Nanoarchaeia archaeon]
MAREALRIDIKKGVRIVDLGIYIEEFALLAFSDVHLGYEEALNKQGILVPKFHFNDLMKRVSRMIARVRPQKILINGDVKHEFGSISDEEWRNSLKFMDHLKESCEELIIIKGNHDKVIDPIAAKRDILLVKEYNIGPYLFVHGDFIPGKIDEKVKTIIIGHEHPAVAITEGVRSETFKCFLYGTWQRYDLIVLPSMNLVTEGTDILKNKLLSPFLNQDLSSFKAWIVGDKVYEFGTVGKL